MIGATVKKVKEKKYNVHIINLRQTIDIHHGWYKLTEKLMNLLVWVQTSLREVFSYVTVARKTFLYASWDEIGFWFLSTCFSSILYTHKKILAFFKNFHLLQSIGKEVQEVRK